jgi:hypothetical protein
MASPIDPLPSHAQADDSRNPYAAPTARGTATGLATELPADKGLVGHVMPVAILMIVQGGLEFFAALVYLGLMFFIPMMMSDLPAGKKMPQPEAFTSILMITYGVMGGGGLLAGVLHLLAGISGLRFRRRVLGMVALIAGMISVSTIYCAPTTIGLAIYGLITYSNPAVVAAFALGDAGMPAGEIRARLNT